ncbi:hypothetical protein BJX70DRAFT_402415 [Aspergillus crustosus]
MDLSRSRFNDAESPPKDHHELPRHRIPYSRYPQNSRGILIEYGSIILRLLTRSKTARGPIRAVAVSHRRHFTEQATEQQTLYVFQSVYQDIDASKNPRLVCGDANAIPLLVNNVSKAELIKLVDFSPAILHQGDCSRKRKIPVGSMVTYWTKNLKRPWSGFIV